MLKEEGVISEKLSGKTRFFRFTNTLKRAQFTSFLIAHSDIHGEPIPIGHPTSAVTTDLNWGGHSVACDFNNPQPVVTGVSVSYVVPQIAVSQNDTFSAIWIGIGGTLGKTLIQIGTEQDCSARIFKDHKYFDSDTLKINFLLGYTGFQLFMLLF